MMVTMPLLRTEWLALLLSISSLYGEADQRIGDTQGNFELRGRVRAAAGKTIALRFRAKAGLGYRIQFGGAASGRLDDPGRRTGALAERADNTGAAKEINFRLTANGPRIELEWNGKTAWVYTEREAGVASAGATFFEGVSKGAVRDIAFHPLAPTPPTFAERYGPGLGERAPAVNAVDQTGKPRDFASLRGPKGLWLLFVRSADW